MAGNVEFLNQLETIIDERLSSGNSRSYVNALVTSGLDRVLKKIGEEAGEVIIAAKNGDKDELLNESADLLYHWLVLLCVRNLTVGQVMNVLKQRHDQSLHSNGYASV